MKAAGNKIIVLCRSLYIKLVMILVMISTLSLQAYDSNSATANYSSDHSEDAFLSCISQINLSFDENCEVVVELSILIRSMFNPDCIIMELVDSDGNILPSNVIGSEYAGQKITYKLRNTCSNSACWGEILVDDKEPPVIESRDTSVLCVADISLAALEGLFEVTDCSPFTTHIRDVETGDECEPNNPRRILRIITAVDAFGNLSRDTLIITILPINLNDIIPPTPNLEVSCGVVTPEQIFEETENIADAYPTIIVGEEILAIMPPSECNIVLKYVDHILETCEPFGCSQGVKISRTWTIIDWCNPEQGLVFFGQVISSKDTVPPVIDTDDIENVTLYTDPWNCSGTHTFVPPSATDECSDDEHISFHLSGPPQVTIQGYTAFNIPPGIHSFGWQAEDCCGNISETEYFQVEVKDSVRPVAISKQNIVIALSYDHENGTGKAKMKAESVDNGSYDLCGDVELKIRRDTATCDDDSDVFGDYVTFCCEDINQRHKVYLLVTDESGNTNLVWSEVLVEAKDVVIECYDVVVDCHEDLDKAIADNKPRAYFQLCQMDLDVIEISRDLTNYDEGCNRGYIEVVYAIEDYPSFRCTMTFYLLYKGDFSCNSINWPEDELKFTDCNALPTTELTWDAGPCDIIGWTVESDTFYFATDACAKIINTYTVIDWCTYDEYKMNLREGQSIPVLNCNNDENGDIRSESGVYVFHEIIKVIDTVPPQLLVCENPRFPIRDNCSRAVILQNFTDDKTDCPNLIIRYELTIITEDGEVYVYTTTTKPGEIASISLTDENGVPILFMGNTSHTAIWKVWDGCGNVNSCTLTFFIIDDKAPTPYCISTSSALMGDGTVELWAKDFDKESFDNCENSILYFTFNEIPPDEDYLDTIHYFDEDGRIADEALAKSLYSQGLVQKWLPDKLSSGKVFTCADQAVSPVLLRVTVYDNTFNSDFCFVELTLADNMGACVVEETAMIAGRIYTEDKRAIPQAMVTLEKIDVGFLNANPTDHSGNYAFPGNTISGNYSVSADKEDNYMNGLSTLDILHIQRHILGITPLTSPYKMIAADVNDDRTISVQDITILQRLILGLRDDLPSGAWKFIDASQELDPETALQDYSESRDIIQLERNMMTEDFIGIKMGDLGNKVVLNARGEDVVNTRSANKAFLVTEDVFIPGGSIAEISFEIHSKELYGYQLHLIGEGLVISHVQFDHTDHSNILTSYTDDGIVITFAHGSDRVPSSKVMTVLAKVYDSGNLSDMITLGKKVTPEAYIGKDMKTTELELGFMTQESDGDGLFKVFQNQPNPFDTETRIAFYLPEEGIVAVQVFDIHGRLAHQNQSQYSKGYNEYMIHKNDMSLSSGMYFYNISYKGEQVSKKMLILE